MKFLIKMTCFLKPRLVPEFGGNENQEAGMAPGNVERSHGNRASDFEKYRERTGIGRLISRKIGKREATEKLKTSGRPGTSGYPTFVPADLWLVPWQTTV